ncbi:MAG: hypothetical protein AAGA30_09755, partial [Planctomycetota bacterium]
MRRCNKGWLFVLVAISLGSHPFQKLAALQSSSLFSESSYRAATADDLSIPVDQLELMARPLTLDELEVEVSAWMSQLKKAATEISNLEIAIKQQKVQIVKDRAVASQFELADQAIVDAEKALESARQSGDVKAIEVAESNLRSACKEQREAQQSLKDAEALEESQSDEVKQAARQALQDKAEEASEAAAEAVELSD